MIMACPLGVMDPHRQKQLIFVIFELRALIQCKMTGMIGFYCYASHFKRNKILFEIFEKIDISTTR